MQRLLLLSKYESIQEPAYPIIDILPPVHGTGGFMNDTLHFKPCKVLIKLP